MYLTGNARRLVLEKYIKRLLDTHIPCPYVTFLCQLKEGQMMLRSEAYRVSIAGIICAPLQVVEHLYCWIPLLGSVFDSLLSGSVLKQNETRLDFCSHFYLIHLNLFTLLVGLTWICILFTISVGLIWIWFYPKLHRISLNFKGTANSLHWHPWMYWVLTLRL